MAEFVTCRLGCPLCGTEFSADEIHGAVAVGKDTDLRPHYEGPSPLLTHIHACPSCSYAGYRAAFETEVTDEDELVEPIEEDETSLPRGFVALPDDEDSAGLRDFARSGELGSGLVVEGAEPYGAVRYMLAARVHEFLHGNDPLGASHYWLRAAWGARATGDAALERTALGELLLRLSEALEGTALGESERVRVSYLTGEIARRAGDFGRAVELLATVERDADQDDDEGSLLATLARRQTLLAVAKSSVNATIPPDLLGRRRGHGDDSDDGEDWVDDDGGGVLN